MLPLEAVGRVVIATRQVLDHLQAPDRVVVERLDDTDVPDIGGGTISRAATWALAPAAAGVLGQPAAGYRPSEAASSNR